MKRLVAFALAAAAAAYLSASPVMAEGLTGCCKKPLRAEASQLTDGLHHLKKPLREARPSVTEQILACNQNLCHIKRPLVQTVADVQVEAPVDADVPTPLLRVFLIAILIDAETGEIQGGVGPVKFPDMASCQKVVNAPFGEYLPPPPRGKRVYLKCTNPSDLST